MHTSPLVTRREELLAVAFALLCVTAGGLFDRPVSTEALLLHSSAPAPTPWVVLTADRVDSGATVSASTNTVFTIPSNSSTIALDVLFGHTSDSVRFWGYCYPFDYDPQAPTVKASGFPGKLFLSGAEQKWRQDRLDGAQQAFSIFNPPTRPSTARTLADSSRIRSEVSTFQPGQTCYVMADKPLPIGTDRDGDGLNSQLERKYHTDPHNPDTDGDGLSDGTEIFIGHTSPTVRDTDGDGIIDGLEDTNLNGHVDAGETNPLDPDTDKDGLCDGFCRLGSAIRLCSDTAGHDCKTVNRDQWAGEDKNLNGVVDSGETDPRKWSTAGDGISDLQRYYNCLLQSKTNC